MKNRYTRAHVEKVRAEYLRHAPRPLCFVVRDLYLWEVLPEAYDLGLPEAIVDALGSYAFVTGLLQALGDGRATRGEFPWAKSGTARGLRLDLLNHLETLAADSP